MATEKELALVSEMIRVCIEGNASNNITETEYRSKHSELLTRYEEQEEKLNDLKEKREKMKRDAIAIGGLLFELREIHELPMTFDEKLWNAAVDRVTVYSDGRPVFRFKDGKDITEIL